MNLDCRKTGYMYICLAKRRLHKHSCTMDKRKIAQFFKLNSGIKTLNASRYCHFLKKSNFLNHKERDEHECMLKQKNLSETSFYKAVL